MSTVHSSEQFGNAMGEGWKEAIEFIFGEDVKVLVNTLIKRKNKNKSAGDIDIAFEFKTLVAAERLLPEGKYMFRPEYGSIPSAKHYLAEIKRSCSHGNEERNIKQFVNFYYALFGPGKSKLRLNASVPKSVLDALNDTETVLLFVFNGADSVTIHEKMKEEINNTTGDANFKICGHTVLCVWCASSEMIKWKEILEKDAVIEEKDAVIEAKVAVIEAKVAVIEEKDAVIEEKDAVIEAKDAEIEEKDAVIEAKVAVIEAKVAVIEEKDAVIEAKVAENEDLKRRLNEFESIQGSSKRIRVRQATDESS